MTTRKQLFLAAILLSSILHPCAFADGYRNPPEGAAAIGAFGGHRAFADDANATIHNSANLVDLERSMLQINTTLGYSKNEFQGAVGNDETENPYFAIPGISFAAPFKEGKYALGLSAYVAYGRSVQWGSSSPFALTGYPYEGSMMVGDLTPNVAIRLNDSLSVGVGTDLYYGRVNQKQFLGPGTLADITADGTALGWNAAITWKMTDRQRIAATYRSPFKIKYSGDLEVTGLPTTDIDATIEYPTIVALAYGVELTENLRVELDAEWLEFSVYRTLTLHNPTGPIGVVQIPQDLEDTWTIGIGGEWDFAEHWTARSGFMYLKNPTPDHTYGTLGPDEDQGVVSIGLGYETEHHAIDVGYAYGLFDGRSISGSVNSPDGKYDYNVHLLTLSYGYKL